MRRTYLHSNSLLPLEDDLGHSSLRKDMQILPPLLIDIILAITPQEFLRIYASRKPDGPNRISTRLFLFDRDTYSLISLEMCLCTIKEVLWICNLDGSLVAICFGIVIKISGFLLILLRRRRKSLRFAVVLLKFVPAPSLVVKVFGPIVEISFTGTRPELTV
jgi:hypothetical protein